MKKLATVLAAIFLVTILTAAFAGCSPDHTPGEIADNYTDLAAEGEFSVSSGDEGESAVFEFGKEITFNTLILRENGSKILQFDLYADDDTEPFYRSDLIEEFRACSFEPVTASSVRIKVNESGGGWSLGQLEAYHIDKQADEDFRIMGYVTVDSLCSDVIDEEYAEVMSCVTQFNVISGIYLDGNGGINYKDKDSRSGGGEADFAYALDKVRSMAPEAEIVVTILGNDNFVNDGYTETIPRHNAAMGTNSQTFIDNILEFIDRWDIDGVSFDYEYPSSGSDFRTYGEFVLDLRDALDEKYPQGKLLTAAIADWNMGSGLFTAEYMAALDQIEVMAYDLFDTNGYHSTFYRACYQIIENCRERGADLSKVHLGVPFYSRPVNGDEFWGNYKDVAGVLSPSNVYLYDEPYVNLDGTTGTAANYFNDRQMIYDKTQYAIDLGLGGIMIWHMACDTPDAGLSLTTAIYDAIADRAALAE